MTKDYFKFNKGEFCSYSVFILFIAEPLLLASRALTVLLKSPSLAKGNDHYHKTEGGNILLNNFQFNRKGAIFFQAAAFKMERGNILPVHQM